MERDLALTVTIQALNNLLENRECENLVATCRRSSALTGYRNLDDGMHVVHSHHYELLDKRAEKEKSIPAPKDFQGVAIAAPVPPYSGYPFRSRLQARFIDPFC